MKSTGRATTDMATRYFTLFVNRLAYTLQSNKPDTNGKHFHLVPPLTKLVIHFTSIRT
jgi:hypothetical protein